MSRNSTNLEITPVSSEYSVEKDNNMNKEFQTNPLVILNEAIEQQMNQSISKNQNPTEIVTENLMNLNKRNEKVKETLLIRLYLKSKSINPWKRRKEIPDRHYEEMFVLAPDSSTITSGGASREQLLNHYCKLFILDVSKDIYKDLKENLLTFLSQKRNIPTELINCDQHVCIKHLKNWKWIGSKF